MFNRIVLAFVAFFSVAVNAIAANGEEKKGCPTRELKALEDLLRQAPSCQSAFALFEICEFGASGDVSLGAAVTEKCEGDFLSKLSTAQRRDYDRKQKRCARKYQNKAGTMYRSFEAFCGASLARDYSAKFLNDSPRRK
jgi:hypothetical protein